MKKKLETVLIPFLAGLLFGHHTKEIQMMPEGLNPLFGGSAFRTRLRHKCARRSQS